MSFIHFSHGLYDFHKAVALCGLYENHKTHFMSCCCHATMQLQSLTHGKALGRGLDQNMGFALGSALYRSLFPLYLP
jgi:hypothetical protein